MSYQGKQVVQAAVVLDAGDGVPRVAGLAEDGTYRFDNVPAGNVRLAVISPDPAKQPAPSLDENGNPMPIPKVDRSRWFPLPETLTDPRTSDLATTVRPGQNTFDIIVH